MAALAALTACGFVPAYGPQGAAGRLRGQVALTGPATPFGYQVLTALEDRLGRGQAARYGLTLTLRSAESPAAVTADGVRSRTTLTGQADYALTDGQAALAQGQVDAFTAYSSAGSTVETAASAADAQARLAAILADLILTRLIAALPDEA